MISTTADTLHHSVDFYAFQMTFHCQTSVAI